jgi:hypothetical protein
LGVVGSVDHDDHELVSSSAYIRSATLHAGGVLEGGTGAAEVNRKLSELVGDRFVVAKIRRNDGRLTLIIDPAWFGLIESLVDSGQDLVEVDDLPRPMLLAVVDGWPEEWTLSDDTLPVDITDDGTPHLRPAATRVQSA